MNPALCFQPAAMLANALVHWFAFFVLCAGTAGAWYYLVGRARE